MLCRRLVAWLKLLPSRLSSSRNSESSEIIWSCEPFLSITVTGLLKIKSRRNSLNFRHVVRPRLASSLAYSLGVSRKITSFVLFDFSSFITILSTLSNIKNSFTNLDRLWRGRPDRVRSNRRLYYNRTSGQTRKVGDSFGFRVSETLLLSWYVKLVYGSEIYLC